MSIEMGISNPALHQNNEIEDDDEEENKDGSDRKNSLSCLPDGPFSADSEYDETLAFPDSVTILSMGGDNPVLVERTEGDDEHDTNVPEIEIKFTSVYNTPVKFKSFQRKIFIPGMEVNVRIIHNDRSITTHLLNPNLYTIELTHGQFTWTIKKRYKHFNALHQQLRVFKASLNFPFPSRSHKEKRASFRDCYQVQPTSNTPATNDKKKRKALPRFPNRPESLVTVESLPNRIQQLEQYLYNLLNISLYRNHYETTNFLEVSNISFIPALGEKGTEGPVMKRTGSTRPGQAGCNCFGILQHNCCVRCNYFCSDVLCGKWRNRWFFVKETFFGYMRPSDGAVRAVVLFDQGFDVSTGMYSTGMRNGMQIITNNRHMILKCWTRRKSKEWMNHLKDAANGSARDFTHRNLHMSFAPVRSSMQAGWFVDGSSYMSAVADALEAATEEIYIADWWLSPEIYMKRPAIDGDYWRLDKILQRKASQGVRVFVLLYKEVEMALGINSYYSKQRLVDAHENIKVMRHPDHARVGVFFWAHHEKIVVVDQTYAFLGGIDLCYGRWDDFRHRLTDLGSISTSSASGSIQRRSNLFFNDTDSAIGSQKSSSHHVTIQEDQTDKPVLEPGDHLLMPSYGQDQSSIEEHMKQNTPEMERRRVLEKFKDNVRRGKDLMHRLTSIDGSNEHKSLEQTKDKNLFFSGSEIEEGRKAGYEDPTPFQTQVLNTYSGQAKFWFGKDYTNFIIKDFVNLDAPYADLVDRTTTPRMPWHDVGVVVCGSAARDVARHFIQRWNATKLEKTRENMSFPYLMPKSYNNIQTADKLPKVILHRVTCQVLRSVSSWSCGFIESDLVEQSIHDAYIQTITTAQHYIYIENQFFITLQMGNGFVKNQVGETLFKRIIRAHKEGKVFRVYVVMPLLPGFEGDVGGTSGNALRAITHWNYASISRGKGSILHRLKEAGIEDPSEYISFHSLRTNSVLNNYPVTELIYVHSKLLIADDKVVICGSANINDRSLIGKRDSEIAVIIEDEEFEQGRMNGATHPCGVYAGRLRKYLFREHLGLLEPDAERMPIDVTDPVIDTFWNGIWKRTSQRNTEIYDEVFKCIPTDNVKSFLALKKYQEEPALCKTDPERAMRRINNIQGHLVHLPLEFLNTETLTPPGTSKEGLIPTSVWT
ncbi:phospholipase D2 isoform X3 [Hermetia illucens]|nr:phospholipase D2 isoform X3 [Hermetia illucens]XP_037918180.1 phospholipase D2 isoform X3 [Hermetia illucens]XP_037918182.1 phospholipase D2 isoform X3 [Hermetia illucens]XP_037918183.1 phospholipase D2 isoform X3 [Hermetia illucens]XP_037918184.1 phospholipase D2 isoform X3 [Hermetia illucens]XP_037918185.1 phospholipase D2 isoform X3 [Hermetia illucens]